jgi:hypothetical protein
VPPVIRTVPAGSSAGTQHPGREDGSAPDGELALSSAQCDGQGRPQLLAVVGVGAGGIGFVGIGVDQDEPIGMFGLGRPEQTPGRRGRQIGRPGVGAVDRDRAPGEHREPGSGRQVLAGLSGVSEVSTHQVERVARRRPDRFGDASRRPRFEPHHRDVIDGRSVRVAITTDGLPP